MLKTKKLKKNKSLKFCLFHVAACIQQNQTKSNIKSWLNPTAKRPTWRVLEVTSKLKCAIVIKQQPHVQKHPACSNKCKTWTYSLCDITVFSFLIKTKPASSMLANIVWMCNKRQGDINESLSNTFSTVLSKTKHNCSHKTSPLWLRVSKYLPRVCVWLIFSVISPHKNLK